MNVNSNPLSFNEMRRQLNVIDKKETKIKNLIIQNPNLIIPDKMKKT